MESNIIYYEYYKWLNYNSSYEKKELEKIDGKYQLDDAETASQYCSLFKLSYPDTQCDTLSITIPDITGEDADEVVGLTKEQFIAAAKDEGEGVTCY